MRPVRRALGAALAAVLLLGSGACSVDVGSSATDEVEPLVKDDQVVLDLQTRPDRARLGLPEGDQGSGYSAEGDEGIDVTVLLPGGERANITAYRLAVTAVGGPTAPPSDVIVNAKYDSVEDLAQVLWTQREALGLEEESLTAFVGPQPGSPEADAGSRGSGMGVVRGLQEDFLTIDIDVRPGAEAPVTANFGFYFDLPLSSASPQPTSEG